MATDGFAGPCLSPFPDDRQIPGDAVDAVQVRLSGMELHKPRPFGNCWLANELWLQLGLDQFWIERLPEGWFVESAMDSLLEETLEVAGKDRLYRCLDRLLEHKADLFSASTNQKLRDRHAQK